MLKHYRLPALSCQGVTPGLTFLKDEKVDKEGLLNAIENLTTYTTPVKAANSLPRAERINGKSLQINKSLSSQSIPRVSDTGPPPTYFLLAHPLTEETAERLLGALILDIHNPRPVFDDEGYRPKIEKSWVRIKTEENSGIYAEWIKSKIVSFPVAAPAPVSISGALINTRGRESVSSLGANVSASFSYKSSSSRGYDISSSEITTQSLNAPRSYMAALVRDYRRHLSLSFAEKPNSLYVITGLKSTAFQASSGDKAGVHETSQLVFAARYTKIECRLIRRNIFYEYNKGAVF